MMKHRIFWDDLRASLWYRPTLWIVCMGLLALLLIALDQRLSYLELYRVLPWLFIDGAEGARTMLGSIGSAMLTVATLAFSIIMLAVVQTANAYSPRILRQYLSDTTNQHVLGILIGTFLYSLLVLRVVRSPDDIAFVPTVSVTVGIAFSLLSIGAFIYFVHHVAHSIEVSSIVEALRKETMEILDDLLPRRGREPNAAEIRVPDASFEAGRIVTSRHSGYIEAIAEQPLIAAARHAQGHVRIERLVGEYVLAGTPLATIWSTPEHQDSLRHAVQQHVTLGRERTMVQDLAYGIRQLSDMALRAISPAINDPSTAINCINVMASILAEMLCRPPASPYRYDEAGKLRLTLYGPSFEGMLDLAFNQIRQYAANDYACTLRLLEVCTDLAYLVTSADQRRALWKHVEMVARSADHHLQEPWDRAELNRRLLQAASLLEQEPGPLLLDDAPTLAPLPEPNRQAS